MNIFELFDELCDSLSLADVRGGSLGGLTPNNLLSTPKVITNTKNIL